MTAILSPNNLTFTPLNANLRLKDILKTLPKECFQKDMKKAWMAVLTNVLMVGLGYASIAIAPWFLLPIAWFFTGTALTGFFVISHDCGHRSFAKRRWVNDVVGHVFMLPLLYPSIAGAFCMTSTTTTPIRWMWIMRGNRSDPNLRWDAQIYSACLPGDAGTALVACLDRSLGSQALQPV